MEIDVALVPQSARPADPAVFVVVDEIRASTTLTTLLDIGCGPIYVEGALAAARRLGRETGSVLVGERHLRRPPGFDFANSPTLLTNAGVAGRGVVLSTTNGTAVLKMVHGSGQVIVGCLRNARACAAAAVRLAAARETGIRIVCAGRQRRFNLEDAVAAGVIVMRVAEEANARGIETSFTDAACASVKLAGSYPDTLSALLDSEGGKTLQAIDEAEDIPFCAEVDVTETVPVLRDGTFLRVERLQI